MIIEFLLQNDRTNVTLLLELSVTDWQTDEHTLLVEKASLKKSYGCTEQEVLQDPHGKVVQGQGIYTYLNKKLFSH